MCRVRASVHGMKNLSLTILLSLPWSMASGAWAQPRASQGDDAGTLHLPDGEIIPYSDLASPQAQKNFIDSTRGYEALMAEPAAGKLKTAAAIAEQERRWYDEK